MKIFEKEIKTQLMVYLEINDVIIIIITLFWSIKTWKYIMHSEGQKIVPCTGFEP